MAPRALNERRDGIQGDATSPNAIAQQGPSQPPGGGPPQSMPTQATSSQTTSASRSPTLIPVSSSSITNPSSRPSSSTSGSSATTVTSTQPTSTNASDSNSNTGFFGGGGGKSTGMIIVIVIIAILFALFLAWFTLRRTRRKYKDPKYLPGKFLKSAWKNWEPYPHPTPLNSLEVEENRQARTRANVLANQALDRHSSVRSVITLPPYREMALMDQEQTIGREGERDGLDNVVVFPETEQDTEARRENRMQAMYELRLQRRQQAAEREARRTGRSSQTSLEGRGNSTEELAQVPSVAAINAEMGGGTRGRSTSDLTAAILNDRVRRSSEVTYHDVGNVRLDGSRIRATSVTSQTGDSAPLLGSSPLARGSTNNSSLTLNTGGISSLEHRRSVDIVAPEVDLGQRLPPSYDGLEWGDAPPYMSPISPVSRRSTLRRVEREEEREGLMGVPEVRVIGASNPNSPHPGFS